VAALALVTGATGFVGSHLVELLLERGYRVRCLVRESSDPRWLPRERVELATGEVTRPESLGPAARGVDFVFHSAGVVRSGDPRVYERVNVEGTRNLIEALLRESSGLRRFVQVSSLAAGGPSEPGHPRSELDSDAPNNEYGKSKKRAEEELERVGASLPWTVVRPCAVYGPRDHGFLLLARLARRGWCVRITGAAQPAHVIHVRDLVRGLADAAESPRTIGRRYYVAHPEITGWTMMGALMGRSLQVRTRLLHVPRWAVPWVAGCAGLGSKVVGRPHPLPPDRLRDLLAPAWTCDTRQAKEHWGFQATVDLRTGIEETMEWYRSAGWV
jgi:nucleoside-diphosphate-sugar epimerase